MIYIKRYISSKALILSFFSICLFGFLGVSAHAANTGIQPSFSNGDDWFDDNPSSSPSTHTDISEVLKSEISDLDSPVILLEHGTIVLASDPEESQALRAPASGDQQIGYSISVSSNIGDQLLVPSDYSERSFSVDGNGHLIGIRSGTFSCYIGEYTVRFPSYGTPQYRLTNGSSYTWTDINITYVESSNVEVVGARFNWWDDRFRTLIAVAGLFSLLILAFRRHD